MVSGGFPMCFGKSQVVQGQFQTSSGELEMVSGGLRGISGDLRRGFWGFQIHGRF